MAKANDGSPPEWLSTHPSNKSRLTEIKKTLPKEIEHIFFSSIAEKGLSKLKDKIWSQLNF